MSDWGIPPAEPAQSEGGPAKTGERVPIEPRVMFIEPTPGAAFGCHDRNLLDAGFQIVIDVVGPTAERLSSPEYDVLVYDQAHPRGRKMTLPMVSFMDDYVRPLTALEREQRLAALHYPVR